ncbi:hypothetical protein CVT24_001828 [Panaeolus cyanescens]|uniref:Endonuclease/exonuclease/phosphatase domain-containing protein n=1 Tax=Panaeolus cyanescens TaxID=181874 RepID=A0A409WSE4_9AGAR|nr:hypothetical protein CVT24_001828 [Panaeolus cyanescens]
MDFGTGNGTHLANIGEDRVSSAGSVLNDDIGEFGSRPQTVTQTETDPFTQQPGLGGRYQQRASPQGTRPKQKKHGKKTKAYLKICSLNMNGGGSNATNSKWEHVNQTIRENNIGIMVLQETHLTPERIESLHKRYKRLHIVHTYDEDQTNSKGVAVVINKYLTRWREIKTTELVPGRAILVSLPWREDETIHILGIYAPNSTREQLDFWDLLTEALSTNQELPNPDFMIGDFNVVESSLDRLPPHKDDHRILEKLHTFRDDYNLADMWRLDNPTKRKFTYLQRSSGSQSRIDRIYVNMGLNYPCYEWLFTHTGIVSDHKMIGVKIEIPSMPFIGQGRWAMAPFLLKDRHLINEIKTLSEATLNTINEKTNLNTLKAFEIQMVHENWKTKVRDLLIRASKRKLTSLDQSIREQESELKRVLNNGDYTSKENKLKATTIELKLSTLNQIKHTKIRDSVQAKFNLTVETISKEWIATNKDHKPRDIIYKLRKPSWYMEEEITEEGPPPERTEYTNRSEEMAKIAAEYHNRIQANDTNTENGERR